MNPEEDGNVLDWPCLFFDFGKGFGLDDTYVISPVVIASLGGQMTSRMM